MAVVVKVLCKSPYVRFSLKEHRGYVFDDDPARKDYDWLVVFDEMPDEDRGTVLHGREPLSCPRERTILCTWEPTSVKNYSHAYTRQFGHLLSNRPPEAEGHPHYHLGRGYYPWFYGRLYDKVCSIVLPEKTKVISAICSAKKMRRTKHFLRFQLLEELSRRVEGLEWWGHGVRDFTWKYDLIDPYKYHIAVENHISPYHWSEKLADSVLGECLTFYAGDPDLGDVLPREAFIPIPIDDPAEAARTINSAIASGEYEKRRDAILEAKRLILNHYNFWDQVIEVIEGAAGQPVTPVDPKRPTYIYARKTLRKRNLFALVEEACRHILLWCGAYRLYSPVVRHLMVRPRAALKLFCVYFDRRPVWRSDCVEPIQAGKRRTYVDLGMLADDTGDNISNENLRYGEMTAWYWVWKNYLPAHPELTHVGFSHYRRFLDFARADARGGTRRMTYRRFARVFERVYTERNLLQKIGDADLVMRAAEDCGCESIRGQMASWRPENLEDFDRFAALVRERHPNRVATVDAALASPMLAMELQFLMRRELFEDFAEWAFGLCREYERRWKWGGAASGSDARVPALLIERFFMVWLALKQADGIRVRELPVVKLTGRNLLYYILKPLVSLMPEAVQENLYDRYK